MSLMSWFAAAAVLVASPAPIAPRQGSVSFEGSTGQTLHADLYDGPLGPRAPVVVLFHQGGGSARGEYGPIIPRVLSRGFNVMAVDLPGGGERFGARNRTVDAWKTSRPGYCEEYAEVRAALRYLSGTQFIGARVLWGSSYSATLVLRLAAEEPSAAAAVIACSPATRGPMEPCKPDRYIERLRVPFLVLRPAAELEVAGPGERARVESSGGAYFVANPGTHGSSMLVDERAGGNTEAVWSAVWRLLEGAQRTSSPDASLPLSPGDRAAIATLHEDYVLGWLKDDPARIMATLAPAAVLAPEGLPPVSGHDAIRRFWWPNDGSTTVITRYVNRVDDINGSNDVAVTRSRGELAFTYEKAGKPHNLTTRHIAVTVFRRQPDGRWLISHRLWWAER